MAAIVETKTQTPQKSAGSRKTVDKWKKKKWFTVLASKIFDKRALGETPGEKPKNVMGRTFKTTMDVVTGQRTKRDYVLSFKVNDIQGQSASTVISSFEVNKGTLGRTVRRRNSKIALHENLPVVGGNARTSVIVVTDRKATNAQKAGVQKIMKDQLMTLAGKDFETLTQELLLGNFSNDLFKKAAKVCPVKKVIVAKAVYSQTK